jgi:hypothetical protein
MLLYVDDLPAVHAIGGEPTPWPPHAHAPAG